MPGLGWSTGRRSEAYSRNGAFTIAPSGTGQVGRAGDGSGPGAIGRKFFPKHIKVCSRKSSTSAACLNRYVSPTFQEHSRDGLRKRLIMRPSFWSASGHRDETFLVFWSCDCCLVVFFGSRVFCVHTRVDIKTPIEKKHYPPRCQATSCNQ